MLAKTHTLSVTPLLLPAIAYIQNPLYLGVFASGLLLGSLLPDIDEENSYISRRFRIAYFLVMILRLCLYCLFVAVSLFSRRLWGEIQNIVSHRGITHFLIIPLLLLGTSFLFNGITAYFILGIALGWLVHQLGDMTTYGGVVNWIFPFYIGKRFWVLPHFLRYRTGDMPEQIVSFFLVLGIAYYVLTRLFTHKQFIALVMPLVN